MSWLDLILLLSLGSYVWGGLKAGLIQAAGGVLGLIIGATVASRQYESFAPAMSSVFGGNEIVGKVAAFIAVFFVVTRIVAILVWFINKLFNIVAIVPGLKFLNRVGGAAFGFLEGALFLGLTLQFVNRLPIPTEWAKNMEGSFMVPFLLGIAGWLVPFLPKALKGSQKAIDNYLQYGESTKKTLDFIQENDLINKAKEVQNLNAAIPR